MTRNSVLAQRAVLTLISTLLLLASAVSGLEVYLRQLNVHQIRRVPVFEGEASIYFQCANEGQLFLPKVQTTDVEYYWNAGDLAVASVPPRSCKACAFWEERKFPFRKDDILGLEFQVCEVDFAENGLTIKSAQDAFDATFECQDCKAVPPAPPPPAPSAPAAPSGQDTQHRSRWLSGGGIAAIVIIASMSGILLGVIGFAVVQHVKAKQRAQAAVAFEAAQSELGLDETFEQDTEAFHQSLLHPSAWYKLKDGPSDGD